MPFLLVVESVMHRHTKALVLLVQRPVCTAGLTFVVRGRIFSVVPAGCRDIGYA